ncbi:Rnase E [Mycobacterium phage BirdsNest]|uniref:DNA binding protein n=1 Tax=Mycobacterium phage BirdsNest TaxID=2686231 RepID=A0A6B9L7B8_9CAUD|nr:Rnase E [Mycobacterium phage BirdsNest]QHB37380.1 DNA binding protein [Mycobacterium phage BirdsNest]
MSAEAFDPADHSFTDEELADYFEAELENRRAGVLLDRLKGKTYAEIARERGISMSTARKDYRLALAGQMEESPELGIAKHRAVINEVLKANMDAMMKGDKDAAATILRALERDAKLKGYDAPTRVLAAVNTRDFANEAAQLISRIQQLDPDTLKELTRVHRPARPILDQLGQREVIDAETVEVPPASPAPAPDPGPEPEAEPVGAPGDDPGPALGMADRRRPAPAPGGKGGDVYSALGFPDVLGGPRQPDEEGRPDRAAGAQRGDAPHQRAADAADVGADDAGPGELGAGGDQPGGGDLDGWSNIEDDF